MVQGMNGVWDHLVNGRNQGVNKRIYKKNGRRPEMNRKGSEGERKV